MRELRLKCGALVMTPDGVREIYSYDPNGTEVTCVTEDGESISVWHTHQLRPLPADIPRERVEALLVELDAELRGCVSPEDAHESLEHFVARLRLLLEVDHA